MNKNKMNILCVLYALLIMVPLRADDTIDDQEEISWKDSIVSIASNKKMWIGVAGVVAGTVACTSWFTFRGSRNVDLPMHFMEVVSKNDLKLGDFGRMTDDLCRVDSSPEDVVELAQQALDSGDCDQWYVCRVYVHSDQAMREAVIESFVGNDLIVQAAIRGHKFEMLWSVWDQLSDRHKNATVESAVQYYNNDEWYRRSDLTSAHYLALIRLINGRSGVVGDKDLALARGFYWDYLTEDFFRAQSPGNEIQHNMLLMQCLSNRMDILGESGEFKNKIQDRLGAFPEEQSPFQQRMTMKLACWRKHSLIRLFRDKESLERFWEYCELVAPDLSPQELEWFSDQYQTLSEHYGLDSTVVVARQVQESDLFKALMDSTHHELQQKKELLIFVSLLLSGGDESAKQQAENLERMINHIEELN